MEGWRSPALEVIAYRAESTVEAGEAGGAAHPVVFHDFQVRRAFDPYGAGNGSIQGLKARQLPFTRQDVPRSVETAAWPLPKVGPLLPLICSVDSLRLVQL